MVGRVCPRHGHRGRPLNWVYKDFPKGQDFCAIREAPWRLAACSVNETRSDCWSISGLM